MDDAVRQRAAMNCPTCGDIVVPLPSSSSLVAWYRCDRCDDSWSARLRDGRPAAVWYDGHLVPAVKGA
jgi:hypothetical protein